MSPRVPPAPSVADVLRNQPPAAPEIVEEAAPIEEVLPPGAPESDLESASAPDSALRSSLKTLHERYTHAKVEVLATSRSMTSMPAPDGADGIGEYVQHLMRQAQATAEAYLSDVEAEAKRRATEIIADASEDAEQLLERARADARALVTSAQDALAERVAHITDLTDRLIQLAEGVVDDPEVTQGGRTNALRLVAMLVSAADAAAGYLEASTITPSIEADGHEAAAG